MLQWSLLLNRYFLLIVVAIFVVMIIMVMNVSELLDPVIRSEELLEILSVVAGEMRGNIALICLSPNTSGELYFSV